ncbi:MAG: aromatic acid exporter family protein, partial [Firmicutes bacterium]|nr:aromatic acid exporter family protein [Bacillota bacterium]
MLKELHFPPIGLRITKSGIAVALCFLIAFFRGNEGIVFYSLLSALWCIQMYRTNTRKNAVQRFSGTVIGALYGLLFLLLLRKLSVTYVGLFGNEKAAFGLQSILVSLFIVLVLYTTVLLKKKQASYFSCVVFLSIAVNHVSDMNPYLFVWNRFLDTCIGIGVGIFVNDFSLPLKKKKDIL